MGGEIPWSNKFGILKLNESKLVSIRDFFSELLICF